MLKRLKVSITYANVTATTALVVALGGTSYAAFTLPRNSVGPRQLRTGAVRSREVKNGSLSAGDLSQGARTSLRGARGPAGPAGAQGPVGPAAAEYFAVVNAAGDAVAGNSTARALVGLGSYTVGFGRSVAGCAATAAIGTSDASTAAPGRITVNIVNGQLGVQTFAADGSPANSPFHVIVAC